MNVPVASEDSPQDARGSTPNELVVDVPSRRGRDSHGR
jgi:hypothetical protein